MSGNTHHDSAPFNGNPHESTENEFAPETIDKLLDTCAPHQRALLGVLAVADVHQLDASSLVSGLADELPGGARQRLELLGERMSEGVDFVDACYEIPSLLPPSVVVAFGLARENGTLSALNATLADRNIESEFDVAPDESNYISRYIGLMLKAFFIGLLIVFISLKIIPEFMQMLAEFGLDAPISLRFVSTIFDTLAKFWFLGLLILIVAIACGFPAIRQFARRLNPFTWRQPLVSTSVDRRRSLALITQTGSSLTSGIAMIMGSGKLRKMFGRLSQANERIEKGQNQWGSLASEKIISRRDADALALSASRETQSWLLQWSANNQQHRESTRSVIVLRTILACVNIALGLLVVLTCIAVFTTLLSIMASLS